MCRLGRIRGARCPGTAVSAPQGQRAKGSPKVLLHPSATAGILLERRVSGAESSRAASPPVSGHICIRRDPPGCSHPSTAGGRAARFPRDTSPNMEAQPSETTPRSFKIGTFACHGQRSKSPQT